MRKIIRTLLLLMGLMLLLTACSSASTIETQLLLNEDLSGKRVMNITVDQSVFSEHFKGTLDDLNGCISANIAPDITWVNDQPYHYTATVEFASPEEYKKKVQKILGRESELLLTAPDSVWASGIVVNEDFTSADLLETVKKAMVTSGYVEAGNESYIFGNDTVKVAYKTAQYDASGRINVKQVDYLPLNRIDVMTDVERVGAYKRSISFDIPAASYKAKGKEITDYFASIVPEGAAAEWQDTSTGKIYTVSMNQAGDSSALTRFTQQALDSNQCSEKQTAENSENYFEITAQLQSKYSLVSMAGTESGKVPVRTFYRGIGSTEILDEYGTKFPDGRMNTEGGPAGYIRVADTQTDVLTELVTVRKNYTAAALNVEIQQKKGQMTKTTAVVLKETPADSDKQQILERLNTAFGTEAEGVETAAADETKAETKQTTTSEEKELEQAETSITSLDGENGFTITIVENGSYEALQVNMKNGFGQSGFTYADVEKKGFLSILKKGAVQVSLNYGGFIIPEHNFEMNTTIKTGFLRGVSKKAIEKDETVDAQMGSITVTTEEPNVSASFVTTRFYLPAVLIWMILLIVWIVLGFLIVKNKVIDEIKAVLKAAKEGQAVKAEARKAAQAAVAQQMAETQAVQQAAATIVPQMETPTEQGVYYCSNCGHPYHAGTVFCEECGTKLEE